MTVYVSDQGRKDLGVLMQQKLDLESELANLLQRQLDGELNLGESIADNRLRYTTVMNDIPKQSPEVHLPVAEETHHLPHFESNQPSG